MLHHHNFIFSISPCSSITKFYNILSCSRSPICIFTKIITNNFTFAIWRCYFCMKRQCWRIVIYRRFQSIRHAYSLKTPQKNPTQVYLSRVDLFFQLWLRYFPWTSYFCGSRDHMIAFRHIGWTFSGDGCCRLYCYLTKNVTERKHDNLQILAQNGPLFLSSHQTQKIFTGSQKFFSSHNLLRRIHYTPFATLCKAKSRKNFTPNKTNNFEL